MSNLLTSWKKEIRSIFRDKKFLTVILLMPFLIPAFVILFGWFYDAMGTSEGYKLGVNYEMSEVEKDIIKSIDDELEIVYKDREELEAAYNRGDIDGYITLDGKMYTLYFDTSNTSGMVLQSIAKSYFEQYNSHLGAQKLEEEGIDPDEIFNSIKVDFKELAKDGQDYFTKMIVSFALIYLVMIISITAMNTSTDIIAGEKERGTFETLLTFPLSSNEIIGGKLLAIVTSCSISSLIGVVTSIPAFMFIKNNIKQFANMNLNISLETILLTILVVLILSCLVGVVAIFLCGRAKSFKEAQSKTAILSFASMIPMFTNMLNISNTILYLIPIANGGQILNDIFLNGYTTNNLLLFIGSSVVLTIVLVFYVSRQYKSEKALF